MMTNIGQIHTFGPVIFIEIINMDRFLVTGAAGFLGYHLTLRLLELGYPVYGIDNLNNYYDPSLKLKRLSALGIRLGDPEPGTAVISSRFPRYTFEKVDIGNEKRLSELFEENRFDNVVHLAAQPGARYSVDHPGIYISTNINGFFNVLENCRQFPVKHLIYASSSSIYGNNSDIPYSENDKTDAPVSLYGATKKSNELMAHSYSHLYGLPITGLRFFTVYGPWGRPDMVYFKYTKAIDEGRPIDVFNHGKLERDYTYINDIVDGIIRLIPAIPVSETPHQVYNIGNSNPVVLLELIEILEDILGKKAIRNMLPMQPGDVQQTFADCSKLEAHCGYRPGTKLEEGLRKFTAWYFNEYLTGGSALA
jgi:UDP-glucuronate 4-epimerase